MMVITYRGGGHTEVSPACVWPQDAMQNLVNTTKAAVNSTTRWLSDLLVAPQSRLDTLCHLQLSDEGMADIDRILNDSSIPAHRGETVDVVEPGVFLRRASRQR